MFDYLIFQSEGAALEHLPPHVQGLFGDLTQAKAERIRALLLKSLARDHLRRRVRPPRRGGLTAIRIADLRRDSDPSTGQTLRDGEDKLLRESAVLT